MKTENDTAKLEQWDDELTSVYMAGLHDGRQRCIALLEGLHEAQRGNQNHNYYLYAANLLKEQK